MEIKSIRIVVTEPRNIKYDDKGQALPLDQQDFSNGGICFGGTSYVVETDYSTVTIQLEKDSAGNDIWFDPCYQTTGKDMIEVVKSVEDYDREMMLVHAQMNEVVN